MVWSLSPVLLLPDQDRPRRSSRPLLAPPELCRLRWCCLHLVPTLETLQGSHMVVRLELSGRWYTYQLHTCEWTSQLWIITFHVEQLIFGRDLRGSPGLSLAVEDPLMLFTWILQHKSLGGVIGHQRVIGRDLLWRDFPVEGHLGLGVGHTTGDHSMLVWPQVDDLKVDGGGDKQVIIVCF